MDIVTLGFRVDGTAIKETTADLAKMGEQGGATEAKLRASLQRTISQIKEMQAAWKGARLGDTEFVQGVQRLQGEADATRSALAKLTLAQEAAKNATTGVGAAAGITDVHIGRLRGSLGTLAAQALGTNPAIVQASSALALLGVGSVVTVGVLAALAAIGAAMSKVEHDAEALRTSVQDLGDAFAALQGLEAERKYQAATIAFLAAADDLKAARGSIFRSDAAALAVYNERLADLLRATDALNQKRQSDAPKTHAAAIHEEALAITTLAEELAKLDIAFDKDIAKYKAMLALEERRRTTAFTQSFVLGTKKETTPIPGVDMAEINRVADELGKSTLALLPPTKAVSESWRDVAGSVANVVTLLANADSASLQFLGTLVTAVGQVEAAIAEVDKVGKLSATSIAGLVATGVSLITQIFSGGESPAQKRSREIQEQNTEAIRKLTDVMTLQVTGNAIASGRAGVNALLAAGIGPLGTGTPQRPATERLDRNAIAGILSAQGTDLKKLEDLAKGFGLTLDETNVTTFIDSLHALDAQLKKSELAHFADTFGGQMELLNAQFKAFNTTDPLERLRQTVAVLTGKNGSAAFAGAFSGQDLAQQSNRAATIGNLQQILQQIAAGTFDTTQTGGLTLKEFVDQLTSTIDLLRQVDDTAKQRDDALQATIDTLQKFGNSLKLDGGLTTLSPVQQLEEARRQYQAVLAQAQAGDQAAAAQLPDAARTFLNASRAVNASGPAFAADFQAVLDQTDAIARLFATQKSQGDQMVAYTGELVYNTAALVDASKDQVAVLKEGFTTLKQQNDDMAAAIEQLIKETRAGAEGGRL